MREGGEREIMPTRKTLNCGSSFRAIIMSAYILWRKTWVATITANNTNATLDPWFWRWIELVILQLGIHKLPRENRIRKSHFRNQFPPWFHYSENLYNTVSKRSVYKIIQFKKKKKIVRTQTSFSAFMGTGWVIRSHPEFWKIWTLFWKSQCCGGMSQVIPGRISPGGGGYHNLAINFD